MTKTLWMVVVGGWWGVFGGMRLWVGAEDAFCSAASAESRDECTSGPSMGGVAMVLVLVVVVVVVVVAGEVAGWRAWNAATSLVRTMFRRPLSGRRRAGIESQVLRPMMTALRTMGLGVLLLSLVCGGEGAGGGTRLVTRAK